MVAVPLSRDFGFEKYCAEFQVGTPSQMAYLTNKDPVLLPRVKNASIIDRTSTSIYLGRDDSNVKNAQMLIGGAYFKVKVAE